MTSPRFNLLPHRQIATQYAGQVLLRQAIVSIVAALLCATAGLGLIQMRIAMVDGFNQALAAEMTDQAPSYAEARRLRGQYQKMLERQQLIEALDARRSTTVLLLNDVAESMPRIFILFVSKRMVLSSVLRAGPLMRAQLQGFWNGWRVLPTSRISRLVR